MDVRLPVMSCLDGFLLSHSYELLEVEDDAAVQEFVGPYKPDNPMLDIENPMTFGPLDLYDYYFEHKRSQLDAYAPAKQAIIDEGKRFGEVFGREYGLIEEFMTDDADFIVVALGSTCGALRDIVQEQRRSRCEGRDAQDPRLPALPRRGDREALSGRLGSSRARPRRVIRRERRAAVSRDHLGDVHARQAVLPTNNYIYGLGGREILPEDLSSVYDDLQKVAESGQPAEPVSFLGLRE
jgi:pyruvate ferredoxin oxidoreductase alpha subunit